MDIEQFRACDLEQTVLTRHVLRRMTQRGISLTDILTAIRNGMIIEEYPEDTPFPSALIWGQTASGQPLHVVASVEDGLMYLITAYAPDPLKWTDNGRERIEERPKEETP